MVKESLPVSNHLSDEQILLMLDGEVSRARAEETNAHLTFCWACRARTAEIEATIEEFVSAHRRRVDPELPSSEGALALLKARLGEAASEPVRGGWMRFLQIQPAQRAVAYLLIAVAISWAGATLIFKEAGHYRSRLQADLLASAPVPDPSLTPGATRPVSLGDVCAMPHEEVVREVSSTLRQQVFAEYGIAHPRAGDYEIDYLIAPGLGGADDIRNLWPQPSAASAWNARTKDSLEERLHQLVCGGKLDLPTAQRAIASNWISAYKKYLGGVREVASMGDRLR